jgi:hypothetical protein
METKQLNALEVDYNVPDCVRCRELDYYTCCCEDICGECDVPNKDCVLCKECGIPACANAPNKCCDSPL